MGELLPESFYARDALDVARESIGKYLVKDGVILRITETEAYRGPNDTAAHARFGETPRTAVLFGPPGRAYIYLCYGIHWMLNFVCGPARDGSAVLIRAAEPIEGLELIQTRRGGKNGPVLLTGPGKIASALALDKTHNHHPLFEPGGLEVRDAPPPAKLLSGPRVGIDFASKADRTASWRFAAADSAWITEPRTLKLMRRRRA